MKKPKRLLRKLLKRFYKKLLLKLHPDRSKITDCKNLCRKLVTCYKKHDYSFLFHIFKITQCSIQLTTIELERVNPFIKEELERLFMSNKCLRTSINKFKTLHI